MSNKLIYLCVTDQPDEVKTTSGRIIILTSYMTSLVLLAAYSAFLTSSLAVQHRDLPFWDLQGLLNDGSYRLGVLSNSSHFDHFNVCGRKTFLSRLLGRCWLGVRRQSGKGWNLPYQVCFIQYFSQSWLKFWVCPQNNKTILKHIIAELAVLRTFYQLPYHNTNNHIQWY